MEISERLQRQTSIHIGLAKAASTSLQYMFDQHDAIEYIGFLNQPELTHALFPKHALFWDGHGTKDILTQILEDVVNKGKKPVISMERLSGNIHGGNADALDIALRLNHLMPKAKIIICIREQIDILTSIYKQFIRAGGIRSINDYFFYPRDFRRPHFCWEFFQYSQFIRFYQDLFGERKVKVLLFEQLRDDPKTFYKELYQFISVPEDIPADLETRLNSALSDEEIYTLRLKNFFEKECIEIRDPNPFSDLPFNSKLKKMVNDHCNNLSLKAEKSIKSRIRKLFDGKFTLLNQDLSQLLDIDLGLYHYQI